MIAVQSWKGVHAHIVRRGTGIGCGALSHSHALLRMTTI